MNNPFLLKFAPKVAETVPVIFREDPALPRPKKDKGFGIN